MEANNSLTFGDLPTRDTCIKLMKVSFASPQKNLAVYKFCTKVFELEAFIESERAKLIEKFGDPTEKPGEFFIPKHAVGDYHQAITELFKMPIGEDVPQLGLTEDDFADERCKYSDDKAYWLNAGEISALLKF